MLLSGLLFLAVNVCLSYQILLPFYAGIAVTFASSFLSHYVYSQYRSESVENCLQESMGSCWKPGDSTWLPALVDAFVSITILAAYSDKIEAQVTISTVVLVQLLLVATNWWIFIELKFIISGIMLVCSLICVVTLYQEKQKENIVKQLNEINIQLNGQQNIDETKLKYLLKKSNILKQDLKNYNSAYKHTFTKEINDTATSAVVAFTLVFILSKFTLSIAIHPTQDEIHIWQWLINVVVESCSNPIILLGIACLLGKLSELLTFLIKAFLGITQQPNSDAFQYKVEVFFVMLFIESGLMTIDERAREQCLEVVIAMALFNVVSHSFSRVKYDILALANGGGQSQIKQYLRLIIVFIALTIGPSVCVFRLCTRLKTSVWPFFIAIGNLELHIEMILLVSAFLYLHDKCHIINKIPKAVRIVGTFSLQFASFLRCYYKLMSPFLTACFWLRCVLHLIWHGLTTLPICYIGWTKYKLSRELIDGVRNLPGCKPSPDNSVCSLCHTSIFLGKQLPCGHIFHQECIERWFHVWTTCPLCNSPSMALYPPNGN